MKKNKPAIKLPKASYKGRWGVGDVQPRSSVFDNKKSIRLEKAYKMDLKHD